MADIFREETSMKKFISILLGMCMVLSMTGCTKETEETKKKKKTKKTKDTEVTETQEDPTDEPSGTETDPSDTEPSDTDPDPSAFPEGYGEPTYISLEADSIAFTLLDSSRVYGAKDPAEEAASGKSVLLRTNYINILSPEYEDLIETVDNYQNPRVRDIQVFYETLRDEFIKAEKNGDELKNTLLETRYRVFRADSRFFSFAALDDTDNSYGTVKTMTICSDCGEEILLSDLVLFKDDFIEYVNEVIESYDNEYYSSQVEFITELIEADQLPFVMVYDGIVIPLVHQDWGSYYDDVEEHDAYDYIKIPIPMDRDIFNMFYFDSVPSEYMLMVNGDKSLLWDLSEDGKMDYLSIEPIYGDVDYEYIETLQISLNGEVYEFTADDLDWLDTTTYSYAFLLKHNSEWYLHVACEGLESYWLNTHIFKITSSGITPVGSYTGWYDHDNFMKPVPPSFIDPTSLRLYEIGIWWGTFWNMYMPCYIDDTGAVVPYHGDDGIYLGQGIPLFTSKVEFEAKEYDMENELELDMIKIPADTTFSLVESSVDPNDPQAHIILQIMTEDPADTYYIYLDLTFEDYTTFYGDTNIRDLFYDILMGD